MQEARLVPASVQLGGEAAEQAEEKMLAASARLKEAQAQAATSRLMDMTE